MQSVTFSLITWSYSQVILKSSMLTVKNVGLSRNKWLDKTDIHFFLIHFFFLIVCVHWEVFALVNYFFSWFLSPLYVLSEACYKLFRPELKVNVIVTSQTWRTPMQLCAGGTYGLIAVWNCCLQRWALDTVCQPEAVRFVSALIEN